MKWHLKAVGMAGLCLSVALVGCASDPPELQQLPPISEYQPSESDMERYRAGLDGMISDYGITEPGEFSIVRWVNPGDASQVISDCLASLGFPVTLHPDGWEVELPPGQEDPFNRARYQCEAQYPTRLDISRPYSSEEIEATYRHLKDVYLPCVEGKGYPGLEMPSFGAYESEVQEGKSGFDPYGRLQELYPELGFQQLNEITESCPQFPEGFRTYPEE